MNISWSASSGFSMWYMIIAYLVISALFAGLFWLALIVARRSDEKTTKDSSKDESNET